MTKILILGSNGQLGTEVLRQSPPDLDVISCSSRLLDITDRDAVKDTLVTHDPDWIINTAAYTAVDKAETDEDRAFDVNAGALETLASLSGPDCRIVHVSTDFVFDGNKKTPYLPEDDTNPLGVYGRSKREGELALMKLKPSATIIRTAWLYSASGNNFVRTMLRLMQERDELSVVDDQIGSPTSVASLAGVIWGFVQRPARGIFHWTDAGQTSWYGFACEILRQALALGLLEKSPRILPIPASEYPTPAQRPAYSVLDCSATSAHLGIASTPWREALARVLNDIKDQPKLI